MATEQVIVVTLVPHTSTCGKIGQASPTKKHKSIEDEEKAIMLTSLHKAFETDRFAQIILCTLSKEKELRNGREAEKWIRECNKVLTKDGQIEMSSKDGEIISPHFYYEEHLKEYLCAIFLKYAEIMLKYGIFDIYKPEEKPFILYSMQKDLYKDFHPSVVAYIPLYDAIDYGFMFRDISTYNPFKDTPGFEDAKPLVYCLFHSLFIGFNWTFAIFMNKEGKLKYVPAIFDRTRMDVDDGMENCRK